MEPAMIAPVLCSLLLAVQSAPLHHRTVLPPAPDLHLPMSSSGGETRLQATRRGGDPNRPTQQEDRRNREAGAVAKDGVWPSWHSLDLRLEEERLHSSYDGHKVHEIDHRSPETVLGSSTINASGGLSSTDSSEDRRSQDGNIISDVKRSGNSQGLGHGGARPVFLHQPDDDLVARRHDSEPPDRPRISSIRDLLPTYHPRDGATASSSQPGVSTSRQIPASVIRHSSTHLFPQQMFPTEPMTPVPSHLMSARSPWSTHTAPAVGDHALLSAAQRVFGHENLVTNPSTGPHSAVEPVPASHVKTSLSTPSTPSTLPTTAASATSSTTSDATDPVLTRVSQHPALPRDTTTTTNTTTTSTNALNDVSGMDHSPGWEGETPTPPYFVSSESEALHSAILGPRDHTNTLSSPSSNALGDNSLVSKARVTRSAELSPEESVMSPALTTVTSITPSPSAAASSAGVTMSFPSPSSSRQPLSETSDVTVVTDAPVKDDIKTAATSASSPPPSVEAEHHDVVPATETVVLLPTESHSIVLQANTSSPPSPPTSARTTLFTTRSPSTTKNSSPPSEPVTLTVPLSTTKGDMPKQSAVGQSESLPTGRLETVQGSTWWSSPTWRAVDVSGKYNPDFRHLSPSGPAPSTTSPLVSVPTEMAGSGSGNEALLDTNPDDISMPTPKEGDAALSGTQSGDGTDVTVHSHSDILDPHTATPAGTSVSRPSSDDNRMLDWGVADSSMRASHSSRTAAPVFTITNYNVDNSPGTVITGNNQHVTSGVTSHAPDTKDQLTSRERSPPVTTEALDTASRTTPAVDGQTMWSPPPSSPTPGLLMVVQVQLQMTWTEFCHSRPAFYLELVEILRQDGQQSHVSTDQIRLMDQEGVKCARQQGETSSQQQEEISGLQQEAAAIVVRLYLVNKSERYDSYLTVVCAQVMKQGFQVRDTSFFKNKLVDVQLQQLPVPDPALATPATSGDNTDPMKEKNDDNTDELINEPGVTIAVVIAAVGGACCVTLIVMQVVLRRRYRRDLRRMVVSRSYSVSSVDSIALAAVSKSRPSSGLFNPALDVTPDQAKPSHVLGATELINFSLDLTKIFEEFVLIPNKTPRLSVVPPGAEDKNRFANVLPIPETRVELSKRPGDAVSSYINANFVTGYGHQKKRYIATQAPLEGTLEDLWRMVWEQRCPAIAMLVNIVEDGHVKFAPYFPESVGPESSVTFGEFCVTMTRRDVHQEYITSWLELQSKKTGERRSLHHFWLTCWPASGRVEPISLVRFVLDIRPAYQDVTEPLLVHCSTGTGRTGTLLALDVCMRQFEERRCVDVMGCVHDLRQERAGCVQTNQQYALLYSALQEYVTIVSSPGISAASSATTLHAMLP